jgi:hypothetical protein
VRSIASPISATIADRRCWTTERVIGSTFRLVDGGESGIAGVRRRVVGRPQPAGQALAARSFRGKRVQRAVAVADGHTARLDGGVVSA